MGTIKSGTTFFIVRKYVSLTLYIKHYCVLFLANFNYQMLQEFFFVLVSCKILLSIFLFTPKEGVLLCKHRRMHVRDIVVY